MLANTKGLEWVRLPARTDAAARREDMETRAPCSEYVQRAPQRPPSGSSLRAAPAVLSRAYRGSEHPTLEVGREEAAKTREFQCKRNCVHSGALHPSPPLGHHLFHPDQSVSIGIAPAAFPVIRTRHTRSQPCTYVLQACMRRFPAH